jgi:hypothetical protein
MVKDLRMLKADGSRNTNMRCSDSTKRLLGLVSHLGGPKTTLLFTANLGMIDEQTVSRHWKKGLFRLNPGVNESTVKYVTTPRHATPRHATPRHAAPRHAAPCCATP